jgi:hypothetical protein
MHGTNDELDSETEKEGGQQGLGCITDYNDTAKCTLIKLRYSNSRVKFKKISVIGT